MNVITVQQVSSTLCMPHLPDEKSASDHAINFSVVSLVQLGAIVLNFVRCPFTYHFEVR
jgi:hypothetical protein